MSSRWYLNVVSLLILSGVWAQSASASEPACTPLLAGQTLVAGTVCTHVDGDDFVVAYATTGGWTLLETHVWVGESLTTMPQTRSGSPKLGHFPYGGTDLGGGADWEVRVPLADLVGSACDTSLVVVSHAVVTQGGGTKGARTETAYGSGPRILPKGSWATYTSAPVPCAPPPPTPPATCIGFSEAMERGFLTVQIVAGLADLLIGNSGDLDVCMDGWFVVTSPTSQDAAVGLRDAEGDTTGIIPAGGSLLLQRPDGGSSAGAIWWCLEKPQTIWLDDVLSTNGAHMPASLYNIYDAGAAEQISDVIQVGIWDAQSSKEPWAPNGGGPALTVGRAANYFAVPAGATVDVSVEVMNLSDQSGDGVVTETTPAGTVATGFSVPPSSASVNPDGSTTYTFHVSVAGRTVGPDAAVLNSTFITYELAVGATLTAGRHESAPPTVTYETNDGKTWESSGSPMILDIQAAVSSLLATVVL